MQPAMDMSGCSSDYSQMLIFYGECAGRQNVPAKSPVSESLENTLDIFRSLQPQRGFLGIMLGTCFVLQLLPTRRGVRIELLDSSAPELDWAETDATVAERLIAAAAN